MTAQPPVIVAGHLVTTDPARPVAQAMAVAITGHVQLTRRLVAPDGTTRLDAASGPRADGAGELLGEDRR
ncbi:hypothetical protein GCM10009555_094200 [Acrocarpospora macrocephala]|uniref:Uncharacterized protein n=1 Tax=Acrocarpospora macrocephala TaxID=150177 RepID=A0A5M3WYN0_9ACTN|nr:hypothetical protein [Acrocarpospora macrocephala]GES11563.1 hypothetical protein Amac_051600 [Acrocarpospora macrocephala]